MSGPATYIRPVRTDLNNRERTICALVAQGYANLNIAARLGITEDTVKQHLHNVNKKLGFGNRVQVALWWDRLDRGQEDVALQVKRDQVAALLEKLEELVNMAQTLLGRD